MKKAGTIRFEFLGESYEMTPDQIEAAYRYQRHQNLMQDAPYQLQTFVFGYSEVDFNNMNDREKYLADEFKAVFGLSVQQASMLSDKIIDAFENNYNAGLNEDENWGNAIIEVLFAARDGDTDRKDQA